MPFQATDERSPTPRHLAALLFAQGLDDNLDHTLHLDEVRIRSTAGSGRAILRMAPPAAFPSPPGPLTLEPYERHMLLQWEPSPDPGLHAYRIEASSDGLSFIPIGWQPGSRTRYVDFPGPPGSLRSYRVRAVDSEDHVSPPSPVISGQTRPFGDEELLTMVQEACFEYYRDGAHPHSGLALEIQPGDPNLVAVGGSGFGIFSLLVAVERGFISRDEGTTRLRRMVRFLSRADRFQGAWPHFLDGRTGRVIPYFGKYDNGGDLVETAFLVQALLAARTSFAAGIHAGGGRPPPRDDNGTLICMASLASFPYTPTESMSALKHLYRDRGPQVWGMYGFHDGFNPTENWFEEVSMGLNQGPIVVIIENHRTSLPWRLFMANPEIRPALDRIGFVPDP